MATKQQQLPTAQKTVVDRATDGGISILTLHGVVDETFVGQKVADSVRGSKVVLNLQDVRRFASWGMSEWMNFLRANTERDIYFIECSSYAVNQMNLVTGLLGQGKLVSFYTPYRCGSCGEEFETLTLVPLEHETIRSLGDSEQPCAACGGRARMEKFPAAMLATIADRPVYDIDDEVVAYLRKHYEYQLTTNANRFRAVRRTGKDLTYLRLSGDVTNLPADVLATSSQGTVIVDLAAVVFDPAQLDAWMAYLQAAMTTASSVQLLDCPPGFLETAVPEAALQSKLKVRTFGLAYHCATCNTQTTHVIDVAAHLEQLSEGMVPTAKCPTCSSPMLAPLTGDQLHTMRRLPARERDVALDRFLAKVRTEPSDKLEDALVVRPPEPAKAPGASRTMYIAAGLAVLVLVGLALIAVPLWRRDDTPTIVATTQPNIIAPKPPGPAFQRPDWITSETPSSAFCQDAVNRIVCIGISAYRGSREDAASEATDSALDELVNSIGLKITAPAFKDVLSDSSKVRAKDLATLQTSETDRAGSAYSAASDVVRKARRNVVELLQASGGAAVPAQRSDWYWEEYNRDKGVGTEFLVFVRYDISLDAVKSLVDSYSTTTPMNGGSAITVFPALAWLYTGLPGGAMVMKLPRSLAGSGIVAKEIVTDVGAQHVVTAADLATKLDEAAHTPGPFQLTVRSGDAAARVVTVKH